MFKEIRCVQRNKVRSWVLAALVNGAVEHIHTHTYTHAHAHTRTHSHIHTPAGVWNKMIVRPWVLAAFVNGAL